MVDNEDGSVKTQADEVAKASSQRERKDVTQVLATTSREVTGSDTNPAGSREDEQITNQELDEFTREPFKDGITLSKLYHRVGAKFGKDATQILREVVGDVVKMKRERVRPPDQHKRIRDKYGTNFGGVIQGLSAIKLRSDGTMPKGFENTVLSSKGQAARSHAPNNPTIDGARLPAEGVVNPGQNPMVRTNELDMLEVFTYTQLMAILADRKELERSNRAIPR